MNNDDILGKIIDLQDEIDERQEAINKLITKADKENDENDLYECIASYLIA